jgi:hypothetical protein
METKTINLRDLPEELVRRAKACAALHGLTLKGFVVNAIAQAVDKDIPLSAAHGGLIASGKAKKKKRR